MTEKTSLELAKEAYAHMRAELEAWRSRHPREVMAVWEEASAKVEGREPNYGPARAYLSQG